MLATLPALIFAPTHLVLARLWGAAEASEPQTETVEALEGAV
jgi:hypothetical protein